MGGVVLASEARDGYPFGNESLLQWWRAIVVDYIDHSQNGPKMDAARSMLEKIDATLNMPADPATKLAQKIAQRLFQEQAREARERGVAMQLQKYPTPLLDAKISALTGLGGELLGHLLAVKQQLGWFNDEVDRVQHYQQMSFQAGLSQENYKRAAQNETDGYRKVKDRAKMVADLIGKINWVSG